MMVQLSPALRPGSRAICAALRQQIAAGVYGRDGALPSSRMLAAELGVSRGTVTLAYEQLQAEGFITVRPGARPRVALAGPGVSAPPNPTPATRAALSAYGARLRDLPARHADRGDHPEPAIDLRYGDLAAGDFPALAWKRAMSAAAALSPARLGYADPGGSLRLRTALQAYLWRARSLRCEAGQIVIVNGSQQGLDLCARLLLDAGDRFVIEDPCYAMARHVFGLTGAQPVPVAVDGMGLRTDALRGVRARLAYVTPSHQFPLGSTMSVSRRQELMAWARDTRATIVEDDYDSEFRYDIRPVPPLFAHDVGHDGGHDGTYGGGANVICLGTISKTLSPSLRIGYLVVPPDLAGLFARAKEMTDRHTPLIEQEAMVAMLESGAYDRHVRRVRRLNAERRETLLEALRHGFGDAVTTGGADAGLHVVAWLREVPAKAEPALVAAAARLGLAVQGVSHLYASDGPGQRPDCAGLVLGYAALDPRRIGRGIALLKRAVAGFCAG